MDDDGRMCCISQEQALLNDTYINPSTCTHIKQVAGDTSEYRDNELQLCICLAIHSKTQERLQATWTRPLQICTVEWWMP
jgi:hypothetical protein